VQQPQEKQPEDAQEEQPAEVQQPEEAEEQAEEQKPAEEAEEAAEVQGEAEEQSEEQQPQEAQQPAVPQKRNWVLWGVLAAVGVIIVMVVLLFDFREQLMPLLEQLLYSEEELEILRQFNI
jgi:uncharacterized membrane protein YdbT with pleckstrin-like domain